MPKAALPGTMVATHTRSTTAPSSVRGILLQVTRFLYYLLRGGPHDVVSLELFEDVGVEHHDGTKTAEQDKSFLSRNPLADRSTALWKTLHNWVDAVSSGALVPEHSRFVIYAPKAAMGDFSRPSSRCRQQPKLRVLYSTCDGRSPDLTAWSSVQQTVHMLRRFFPPTRSSSLLSLSTSP